MDKAKKMMLLTQGQTYTQRLISLIGTSLIAYYPLDETSGTTALDKSGNGRNGAYAGTPTLANKIGPTGKPSPLFNTGDINVQSASLAAALNPQEFTIGGFFQMQNLAVWTNATISYLFYFIGGDTNNRFFARRETGNNAISFYYIAGAVIKSLTIYREDTVPFHLILSVSKANDRAIIYKNGVLVASFTGLGTFSGSLVGSRIGGINGSSNWHLGWASDFFVAGREVTSTEARSLATASIRPKNISILGDSIPAVSSTVVKWPYKLSNLLVNGGYVEITNHSTSGHSILSNLAAQVLSASADNADIIIITLGVNDSNGANMVTLQAAVETAITDLRASNPNAVIYYMNVMPCWTDVTGATPLDKSNIRTAIVAACAAKNVEVWDTFDTPLITAAQTLDGVHPTAATHGDIIAPFISARL